MSNYASPAVERRKPGRKPLVAGEPTRSVSVRLPSGLHDLICRLALRHDISDSAVIRLALKHFVSTNTAER